MALTSSAANSIKLASGLELPPESVSETFAILANRGAGKALALDTPIATRTGWTTMGDIRVGDEVFGSDGVLKKVTHVHPVEHNRPVYEVLFTDGVRIRADENHLWLTDTTLSRMADSNARRYQNRGRIGRPQCTRWRDAGIRTTKEIAETLRYRARAGERLDRNHSITNTAPLVLPVADLPIDPYVLGAWLGDGTSANGNITTMDDQIVQRIKQAGYEVLAKELRGRATTYRIVGLHTQLRALGLIKNKHVPALYLRASQDQRLALLAGMLDTDGWIESGAALVGFKVEALTDAVHEIAVSMGWKAFRTKKRAALYGVECAPSHVVAFRPDRQVFALDRKRLRLPLKTGQARRHTRRMIDDVRPVESVPVRCITVEGDGMFLAGRDMVPTHNSATAHRLVEQMHRAGLPVVVLDVKGDWWGIRSNADGSGPGLPFVIFGGDHGDVPLEATAGELLADLIVDDRIPAVLDLSHMSKTKARMFATVFAERLYTRNRDSLHVVIEEADVLIPQRASADTARLLGAMEDIAKRGRSRGLGLTVVTQRPQEVAKSVLELMETVILMRMTGTRSIKAAQDWISVNADQDGVVESREVIGSLPALQTGEAWVWSPAFLRLLKRVRISMFETFDSHATPKPGQTRIVPKRRADIDLEKLGAEIAATVQRAQEQNPKALRANLHQLSTQLANKDREIKLLLERIAELEARAPHYPAELFGAVTEARRQLDIMVALLDGQTVNTPQTAPPARLRTRSAAVTRSVLATMTQEATADGAHAQINAFPSSNARSRNVDVDVKFRAGAQRMLESLGRMAPSRLTKAQWGTVAKMKHTSGTFSTYLGELRRAGLLDEDSAGFTLTDTGFAYLGGRPSPMTGEELQQHYLTILRSGAARMLQAIMDAYPSGLTKDAISERVGIVSSSGTFSTYLGELRRNGLIEQRGTDLVASDILMRGAGI